MRERKFERGGEREKIRESASKSEKERKLERGEREKRQRMRE